MKKLSTLFLIILALFSFTACSSSGTPAQSSVPASGGGAGEKKVVYLYQSKIEIDEALKKAAAMYNKSNPNVEIKVESSANDYAMTLKTKFSGGQAPDIFMITGNQDMMLWMEHLADLSDQPWVNDMIDIAKSGITYEGGVYGLPLSVEGYGLLYRKDLFEQAGITELPKTLDELEAAFQKLDTAGITPCTESFIDWFQPGMFFMNSALARQSDPLAFIDGLNNGTASIVGNQEFLDLASFISTEMKYCDNPMNTDFGTQMMRIANGEVAITNGGNWSQPTLDAVDPNMSVGLMPMPLSNDPSSNESLYAAVTGYWGINKNSAATEEAKAFLTWLVTSEDGRSILTKDCKIIPAFKSIPADSESIGALGRDLEKNIQEGKAQGIYNSYYPDGAAQVFGEAIQKFAAGKSSSDELLSSLQESWDSLKK